MSKLIMFLKNSSIKLFLIISIICSLLYGCYKVRIYHDTDVLREIPDGKIYTINSLVSRPQIDSPSKIRSKCPGGASLIEIEKTMLDGLTSFISLGFYNPQTIRVWCKRRKR